LFWQSHLFCLLLRSAAKSISNRTDLSKHGRYTHEQLRALPRQSRSLIQQIEDWLPGVITLVNFPTPVPTRQCRKIVQNAI
jgi:hypothetical protein